MAPDAEWTGGVTSVQGGQVGQERALQQKDLAISTCCTEKEPPTPTPMPIAYVNVNAHQAVLSSLSIFLSLSLLILQAQG